MHYPVLRLYHLDLSLTAGGRAISQQGSAKAKRSLPHRIVPHSVGAIDLKCLGVVPLPSCPSPPTCLPPSLPVPFSPHSVASPAFILVSYRLCTFVPGATYWDVLPYPCSSCIVGLSSLVCVSVYPLVVPLSPSVVTLSFSRSLAPSLLCGTARGNTHLSIRSSRLPRAQSLHFSLLRQVLRLASLINRQPLEVGWSPFPLSKHSYLPPPPLPLPTWELSIQPQYRLRPARRHIRALPLITRPTTRVRRYFTSLCHLPLPGAVTSDLKTLLQHNFNLQPTNIQT